MTLQTQGGYDVTRVTNYSFSKTRKTGTFKMLSLKRLTVWESQYKLIWW